MKILFKLFCTTAFVVSASAEVPIDGKWEARFTNSRGPESRIVFELKADGPNVTGTISTWSGSQRSERIKIQDGKILAGRLTFSTVYTLPFLEQRFLTGRQIADWIIHFGAQNNTITGVIKNDTIKFTQHDWTGQHSEFEAKKTK
jgi:hypothetical protein